MHKAGGRIDRSCSGAPSGPAAQGDGRADGAGDMSRRALAVDYAVGPRMLLWSGAWLDLLDPRASGFGIEDVAHGLAHVCRYAGQCNAFYSVAEHSLLVSEACPTAPFAALMHDAAEAFIGDVTRPLKQLLPDYRSIERGIEAAIFERFGLCDGVPPAVKAADLRVLAAEQAQVMPRGAAEWAAKADVRPAEVRVRHLPPAAAKQAFLVRFHELTPRHARPTR